MPYIKETCIAGKTIEINKYYSYQVHPIGGRAPKEKPETESSKKRNLRNAVKKLRRILNTNFVDGDYLVRMDFQKVVPKDSEEMQALTAKAIRKIKAAYKRSGSDFKYVYVKEIGPKGSKHIHMVCNRCDLEFISKNWTYGYIHIDPLSSDGQYSKIAEYFIKYSSRTEATEGSLIGKRWNASLNLKKPKISKRVIKANRFKEEPIVQKGYYLDKDSVTYGVSELTGYEYYGYTLIKGGG